VFSTFRIALMLVPDVRRGVAAASAQAQRLPKAVRWNEGSDAEPFMSTVLQTVFLELMQM